MIKSYRDLSTWQHAFELGVAIYDVTAEFPASERFGLTNQLRRAGVSVASNIAEGYGRGSTGDYLRFLRVARGSLYEIDTQLLFSKRLKFLKADRAQLLECEIVQCGRLLGGLIRSIERTESRL